jgi:hypothetical protein
MPVAGQVGVAEDVPFAREPELERLLPLRGLDQPVGQTLALQGPDRSFLDEPGPRPLLDEGPALLLEEDDADAGPAEQVRHGQAGRPGPDDGDRRARGCHR